MSRRSPVDLVVRLWRASRDSVRSQRVKITSRLPDPTLLLAVLITAGTAGSASYAESRPAAEGLRAEALALVNDARSAAGRPALRQSNPLNAAAQAHARDMLARDYYSHASPEGESVQDRYIEHGGSRWRLVAENIAMCRGCTAPPEAERVRAFHEGWMDSDGHRRNILAPGLDAFGFGIAGGGGRVYAVQTFAGPGMSPGAPDGETGSAVDAQQMLREAVAVVNRAREAKGVAPLQASEDLALVAEELLASAPEGQLIDPQADLGERLPGRAKAAWGRVSMFAAACGGCGASANATDVERFVNDWVEQPEAARSFLSARASHLGFAIRANGKGRKAAAALVGEQR